MKFLLLLASIACFFSLHAQAQQIKPLPAVPTPTNLESDAATDISFARKLEQLGDLRSALVEWQRAAHWTEEDTIREMALFQTAKIYRELGEHQQALSAFERFGAYYPQSPRVAEALYAMSLTADHLEEQGGDVFRARLQELFPKNKWTTQAHRAHAWQQALQGKSFSPGNDPQLQELAARLEKVTRPFQYTAQRAAFLAIIPGLGHLYLKDWRTAITAFLLNALFIWALLHALRERQAPYTLVFLLFVSIMYSGTIFSAFSLAKREAREARIQAMHNWHDLAPGIKLPDNAQQGSFSPAQAPLWFYRNVIGTFDGPRGNGFPVTSLYAKQAYEHHGPLYGTWMMVDRLLRDWREINQPAARLYTDGKLRYVDPLLRNTFWLDRS